MEQTSGHGMSRFSDWRHLEEGLCLSPLTSGWYLVSDSIAQYWRGGGPLVPSPAPWPPAAQAFHGTRASPSLPPARRGPRVPRQATSGHPSPMVINNWVLGERQLLIPARAAPGRGNLWKHWRPR